MMPQEKEQGEADVISELYSPTLFSFSAEGFRAWSFFDEPCSACLSEPLVLHSQGQAPLPLWKGSLHCFACTSSEQGLGRIVHLPGAAPDKELVNLQENII